MRRRTQRFFFRMSEVFDYRTFLVGTGFVIVMLVGYLVFAAVQSAHDANVSSNQRGKAATRRIDGLQQTVADQAQTIAQMLAQQARSDAAQDALARQVRQLGGEPVVSPAPRATVYVVRSPSPTPKRESRRPFVSPSPSRTPRPSPSASPTCLIPLVGCRR